MTGKRDARHVLALALLLIPFTSAHGQPVADHLKCYKVKDSRPKASYTADLGGLVPEPGCRIKVPAKLLCVETAKTNVQPRRPEAVRESAGRFACYTVKCPETIPPTVAWLDQFGAGTLTPSTSKLLCAPEVPFCRGAGDCPIGTAAARRRPVRERVRRCEPFDLPRWLLRRRHLPARHGGECLRERWRLRGLRCNEPVRERLRERSLRVHLGGRLSGGRTCLLAGIDTCTTACNAPNVTRATAAAARRRSMGLASPAPRTRRAGTRGRRAWTARAPLPAA